MTMLGRNRRVSGSASCKRVQHSHAPMRSVLSVNRWNTDWPRAKRAARFTHRRALAKALKRLLRQQEEGEAIRKAGGVGSARRLELGRDGTYAGLQRAIVSQPYGQWGVMAPCTDVYACVCARWRTVGMCTKRRLNVRRKSHRNWATSSPCHNKSSTSSVNAAV